MERLYKPFTWVARYYIKKRNFFALDSSYMDRQQLDWPRTSTEDL
jgi:hypothetical protein